MRSSTIQSTHPIWDIPRENNSAGASRSHAGLSSAATAVLAIGIAAAVVAPWLVHLVSRPGVPLGPMLLPIFYAPMLAALLLRLPLAVVVSAATPFLSRLLTGMPPEPILAGMMLQISLFVIAVRALRRFHWLWAVPLAYLGSLVGTAIVAELVPAVLAASPISALQSSWPGVLILAGLGLLAHETLR